MLTPNGNDRAADGWKTKYTKLAEELNRKEREWVQAEELLRRTIRRLTIAANGVHPSLDKQLTELRNVMNSHLDLEMLKQITDSMPATLMALSQETAKRLSPAQALDRLAEQLGKLDRYRTQISELRRRLDNHPNNEEIEGIISSFGTLIGENSVPAADSNRSAASSLAADDVNLINVFVSRLDFPEIPNSELKSIQARSIEASAETRKQLAIELTTLLNRAGQQLEQRLDSIGTHYEAKDAILLLLDFLSFPADLKDEVDEVRRRLEPPLEKQDWLPLLKTLAAIIERARSQVQQQKRELESFLNELADQIKLIEENISGISAAQQLSKACSEKMQNNVDASVKSIQHSIESNSDLDTLKQSVIGHLDGLRQHMKEYLLERDKHFMDSAVLAQELAQKVESMEGEARMLRAQVAQQRERAVFDPLTKLYNRLAFDERILLEFGHWKRDKKALSLIVLDADHFKLINDSFGHLVGDEALRLIANILQQHSRETDFVARYGGEEFIMILPGADGEAALSIAEDIRRAIEFSNFTSDNKPVPMTISAGIASFETGDDPETVFSRADNALYEAKRLGRNRCQLAASKHAA